MVKPFSNTPFPRFIEMIRFFHDIANPVAEWPNYGRIQETGFMMPGMYLQGEILCQ